MITTIMYLIVLATCLMGLYFKNYPNSKLVLFLKGKGMYRVRGFIELAIELKLGTNNEDYETVRKRIARRMPNGMKELTFSKNVLNNNKIEYVIIVASGTRNWNKSFDDSIKIMGINDIKVEKIETDKKYYKIHI